MIYFDHNATTPLDDRVLEAMMPYMKTLYGNPSSLYRFARFARSAIDTAREQLASLIDAEPRQVVFTSGGTEANAMALVNAGCGASYISAIEHPSLTQNTHLLKSKPNFLAANQAGLIPLEAFSPYQLQNGDFISVMLANNETGVIQNISSIVENFVDCGIRIHTDAIQALGKIPLSFKKLGVQLMSLSSHKIYGPKGCGALIYANDIPIHPLLQGGDQEYGLRAGTENVAAIVGFGKAAELAKAELSERINTLRNLRDRLEKQLRTIPDLVIFAEQAPRLPNTMQFGIAGIKGEMLLMQLDKQNIAVSSGSACSASSTEISPVLAAMGVEPALARSAIRISLGKDNTEQEVEQFVSVLKTLLAIN